MPGVSVSVNMVMSQLERDPGEFIVDPWVTDRVTLVAGQRRRVVATAHLLRYGGGEEVGDCYRDAGEINWLLHWSARRPTGCDWRGSSGCSTTPPPTSTITRRCWDASVSASSPARPAAGSTRGREIDAWPAGRCLEGVAPAVGLEPTTLALTGPRSAD